MKKLFYVVVFSFCLMSFVALTQFEQSQYWEAKYQELHRQAGTVNQTCDVTGCSQGVFLYDTETMRETCRTH